MISGSPALPRFRVGVTTRIAAADAVRRLDELDTLPVAAHPDVFERLHAELRAALTNAEPESSGTREPE